MTLRAGIAACLIARNEEAVIGRCLESLRELDQVVVADTGSSDRTPLIAARAGAEVLKVPVREPFHFGDARQAALERASRLWVLSIDADEVLLPEGLAILKRLAGNGTVHAWEVGFLQRGRYDAKPVRQYLKRFFRAGLHRWALRVHEQVVPRHPFVRMATEKAVVLEHFPAENREKRKGLNFELLKIAAEESPECPRLHFYLADEYRTRNDLDLALAEIDRYLASGLDEGPLWNSEARLFRGMMLGRLGRKDEALRALERAWEACPVRREPLIHAAELEIAAARHGSALVFLERALAIPESEKPDFHLNWPTAWGKIPQETAGDILRHLERAVPDFWSRIPAGDAARLKDLMAQR